MRASSFPRPTLLFVLVCACLLPACTGYVAPSADASLTAEQALERMQGRWRSVEDAASVVEFDGERMISTYDGEETLTDLFTFGDGCRPDDRDLLSFTVSGEAGVFCYYLLRVNDDVLEYSFADRGNTLSYRRIE